jgi:predicted DNA-binding transcriptional regulator AlpA
MLPSVDEKFKIAREKNTFFAKPSPRVEQIYQNLTVNIVASLKRLKTMTKPFNASMLNREKFAKLIAHFLQTDEYGLDAALALCGLSREKLYRIISFLRLAYTKGLYKSTSNWIKEEIGTEWKEEKIKSKLQDDPEFALDLAKILIGEEPLVNQMLSPFERRNLTSKRFLFIEDEMLDVLARYSLHGSYSASKGGAPEDIIKSILDEMEVLYDRGEIEKIGREIDFIIPSKTNPKVFIQCAYNETTSSAMGDKAKAERDTVARNIKQNYPDATFIIFVDGVGWLMREGDLKIMCEAGDYVFTFHEEELERFKKLLSQLLSEDDYRFTLRRFVERRKG